MLDSTVACSVIYSYAFLTVSNIAVSEGFKNLGFQNLDILM